jgi:hypothetical protein
MSPLFSSEGNGIRGARSASMMLHKILRHGPQVDSADYLGVSRHGVESK